VVAGREAGLSDLLLLIQFLKIDPSFPLGLDSRGSDLIDVESY
jgi:hypothetical protein